MRLCDVLSMNVYDQHYSFYQLYSFTFGTMSWMDLIRKRTYVAYGEGW